MESLSGENLSDLGQAAVRLAQAAATLSTAAQAVAVAAEYFSATSLNFKSQDYDGFPSFMRATTAIEVTIDEHQPVPENPTPDDPPKIDPVVNEETEDEQHHEERVGVEDKVNDTSGKNVHACLSALLTSTHFSRPGAKGRRSFTNKGERRTRSSRNSTEFR
jgi:hypothetical protein